MPPPRTRSPAYPGLGLEEAIRKAQLLYAQNDHHAAPLDGVAATWEYAPTSSSLFQAIAALKQFGLLVDEGSGADRKVKLTELAMDILLHEEGSLDRVAAIQAAALNPKLHRELWDKYDERLPPSDHPIRFYLLRERPDGVFNKDSVDGFIGQFRGTIQFAGLGKSDKMATPDTRSQEPPVGSQGSETRVASSMRTNFQGGYLPPTTMPATAGVLGLGFPGFAVTTSMTPGVTFRELPVTLPSLEIAVLKLPVPMSEDDFATLVNTLTGFKKNLIATPGFRTATPQGDGE